jgi:small-conductance mechanosensitive channel
MSSIKFFVAFAVLFVVGFLGNDAFAQDSLKLLEKQKTDSALLSDTNVLTKSDYLSALEKVLETQNKVPAVVDGFADLDDIQAHLTDDDSAIFLIKERLATANDRTLNIQNLQTFERLLEELQDNIKDGYNKKLAKYETQLDELKKELLTLRKDTIVQKIYRSADLRSTFLQQLIEIRAKWKVTDSLVTSNATTIKKLKSRASSNSFAIAELVFKTEGLLDKASLNAFGKEHRYLWEPVNQVQSLKNAASFKKKVEIEKEIARYYFKNTRTNRLLPLLIGFIFFIWVMYNFKSLKKLGRLDALDKFNFRYVSEHPLFASLIFVVALAPLFDLDAPVIYTDFAGFLTLFVLTVFFVKRLPLKVFLIWVVFFLLFLAHPIIRLLGLPGADERLWNFFINSASTLYGVIAIIVLWKRARVQKPILTVGIIFIILNILAMLCNLYGRVTLSQIFYAAAVYGFAQAVSLTMMVHLVEEAALLQIQSSRLRKNYPEYFDFKPIAKGVFRITTIVAVALWFVIFADNINVFDIVVDKISAILSEVHSVGSFDFSLGGLVLFILIIWVANFLQKYISYFFGDLGEDIQVENKDGRSRLLMTRLVLLIAGFLLAVAASGLPIDKITIILGALSVGIGLGLQNIVNNFVSGIILIFDRTLHIGDVVEVSDKKGRVREIGIRTSKLLTDDGAEIIIPNGDVVSHNIINWTLTNTNVRMNLTFTIAKPYILEDVISICKRELAANKNILPEKEPEILITTVTATSATLKLYFWCKSITLVEATNSQLNPAIYSSLEAGGIKLA